MWCYIRGIECYKSYCDGCSMYNFPINIQFNYECPNCHGKFNYPAYKYFQISTENSMIGYYANACPFCGKEMKGL